MRSDTVQRTIRHGILNSKIFRWNRSYSYIRILESKASATKTERSRSSFNEPVAIDPYNTQETEGSDPSLGWDLGETGATVALRMPNHPLTLALLRATGPMAVTSANPTGQPPATDAASGRAAFPRSVRGSRDDPTALGGRPTPGRRPRGGRAVNPGDPDGPDDFEDGAGILVLDGGPTPGPVPSTIVNLAGDHALAPVVVRQGALPHARLAAVVDPILTALGAPPLTGPDAVGRGAPKEAGA